MPARLRPYAGMIVIEVFVEVLLPVGVIALAGFLMRRFLEIEVATLNRVALYGFAPALIFVSLIRADLSGEALQMLMLSTGLVAALAVVTLLCAWPLGIRGPELSALLLCCMFMNAGNYGLPTMRFAFGEQGFQLAVLFFIPQSMLTQLLGVGVAAAGGAGGGIGEALRTALRRVAAMPQLYAISAALLVRWSGFELDGNTGVAGALFRGVALMAEATLPLFLAILGMQLARGLVIERGDIVGLALVIRLLVSPLLALGLGLALGMDRLGLGVGVAQAAMPMAVNTSIIALEFKARPAIVAAAVVISTPLSLATLSLILALLR